MLGQDAILVGGGNTANMLAVWRVHGFDTILREAWEAGVVLCGRSAGMICWFEAGVTDSFGPELAGMRDGLGFLPGSACPHYDGEERRRPVYTAARARRASRPAYAADDGVGLVFDGTELARGRDGARPGSTAYRVTPDGEERAGGAAAVSREVKLSSADRVLYPESGITKGDVFDYYGRIAPVLVPHLRDRPFTMKRWPHGIHGEAFFQKQAPRACPTGSRRGSSRRSLARASPRLVDFPLLNSREAVLFMVQQNCIDMNAWYSRIDKPTRPDFVLFDLDPPDGEFKLGVKAAHLVREALDELELRSYVKTSGSEGIHVLVPIARRYGFDQTHRFAELVSKRLAAENPGVITTEWLKRKRVGVLIDFHQNGAGRTIASAYSVRPKEGAPVSTPLRWEELTPRLEPWQVHDGRGAATRGEGGRPLRARAARRSVARRRPPPPRAPLREPGRTAESEPERRQEDVEDEVRGDEDRQPDRPPPLRHGRLPPADGFRGITAPPPPAAAGRRAGRRGAPSPRSRGR